MGCKYIVWDKPCDDKCEDDYCSQHSSRKCYICGRQSVGDLGVYGADICDKYPGCENGL